MANEIATVEANASVLTPSKLKKLLTEQSPPAAALIRYPDLLQSHGGLIDFATVVSASLAAGKLTPQIARELRHQAEFAYTVQMAQGMGEGGTQVNYVQQLITLAGGTESVSREARQTRKVINGG
ncbi:MAG TPA: hypothetical protein VLB09_01760 [Nitrospiria bacterium]|jgi:hypothetical protein|nr:MAG: hypothetical protein JSU89_09560 [Myxococcales bacterium]HSG05101.1 hypothetical protein [Nitrospiria bacterium]